MTTRNSFIVICVFSALVLAGLVLAQLTPGVNSNPVYTKGTMTANDCVKVVDIKTIADAGAPCPSLVSTALTGNPTAPTQTPLNNSTRIATTAYTDLAVGVETSRATTAEALLAPQAAPTFTGTVTTPGFVIDGTAAASTGHAFCWKANKVPGYCSDAVASDGTCTCN